jgi:hypothetical protein
MKVVIFRYILLLLTAIIVSTFILKTAVDFNAEAPRVVGSDGVRE